MGRLIEIQVIQDLPSSFVVRVGDVLVFEANGGCVCSKTKVVELLGSFLKSVMGSNQQILSPMGAPNAVIFIARQPGSAKIEIVKGDLWHIPETIFLEIIVSQDA